MMPTGGVALGPHLLMLLEYDRDDCVRRVQDGVRGGVWSWSPPLGGGVCLYVLCGVCDMVCVKCVMYVWYVMYVWCVCM